MTSSAFIPVALLFLLFAARASAQEADPQAVEPDSTVTYRITMKDGSVLQGQVMATDRISFTVKTLQMGTITVQRGSIDHMAIMSEGDLHNGEYWFTNPNASRYLISSSAIPLRRGEGYYQNTYLLLNSFAVGVTNAISVGGGLELLSTFSSNSGGPIFFVTAKGSGRVARDLHVGGAAVYMSIPVDLFSSDEDGDDRRNGVGAITPMVTYGDADANVTGAVGWGYNAEGLGQRPVIMASTALRFARKTAFISENWVFPEDDRYYPVLSYGLRFMGEKIAVDLAFINNGDIAEVLFIGYPFVDFVVKF